MKIEDIPMVCEFPKVFPEELPELLQSEIDFEIELIPGAQPIYRTAYRIS